jgi:hypothetical protein
MTKSLDSKLAAIHADHPMLHAALLRFDHPATGEPLTFKKPPPPAFQACANALSGWPF